MDRVIDALIDRGLNVTICSADTDYFGNFPAKRRQISWSRYELKRDERGVIADAKRFEVTFLVQIVDHLEGLFERNCAIRSVQVPKIESLDLQRFK